MIENHIEDALNADHIISVPIERFNREELEKLSEKAKEKNVLIALRAEHSNAHQGVLVSLVRKDIANQFIEWL